ncbi:MAG: gamma-glutamylcyclotransferase [Bryobacteraceae bacterium]|nr:gamma-glutamylcyclotransferase [Bryobacteraceae bacterium]
MRLLFVYGTLRRGSANVYARRLEAEARWLGEAELLGRLIALGEHRALVDGEETITGEVWEVPEGLWPVLDEYEGEEYVRVECEVRLKSGERVRAEVYRAAGGR